jgi:hypothetical protein
MAGGELPADVEAFLGECIESFEQLEVLLWLRSRQHQAWAPRSVAALLPASELVVEEAVQFLSGQGLLIVEPGLYPERFRFNPERSELVARVAESYREHRLEIMRLMTVNAIERVRARAASTFSGALGSRRRE